MTSYQPSGCGIFGVLRKAWATKIRGLDIIKAIERVRYRGSDKGAGFAVFNLEGLPQYRIKVFVEGSAAVDDIYKAIESCGLRLASGRVERSGNDKVHSLELRVYSDNIARLKKVVRDLNVVLWKRGVGRIYASGGSLDIYKGVGYPSDVASSHNIESVEGDMWLAHTRQPTNSPGHYPYWSHPFAATDIAVVHNGDLSSFGANMEFLESRGWGAFVGTDSEVIAMIFQELIDEGLDVEEAVEIMINPSRRLQALDPRVDYIYRNARLDGPFSVVIGYNSGDDLYMIVIADRFKLRPIVLGEDGERIYAASEENQIRELSPTARVWTLKPGYYMIASLKRGIISYGRPIEEVETFSSPPIFMPQNGFDIDARYVGYKDLDEEIARIAKGKRVIRVANVMGHRYIGISLPRRGLSGLRIELFGVAGNCLANLNENNHFYVFGNVGDDCGDTMHGGKIVVTGDARDVVAQTLQGGKIFIGGNAGNRVGIQMREYRDKRPYLVIGGGVDNYLGEYMAGGVIIILNSRGRSEPAGYYIGTGMIGGRIYIRGRVSPTRVGLQPSKTEMIRFLRAMLLVGYLDEKALDEMLGLSYIELIERLPGEASRYAKKLYEERVGMPSYEYRELMDDEIKELLPIMREYSEDLGHNYLDMQSDRYTVITPHKNLAEPN